MRYIRENFFAAFNLYCLRMQGHQERADNYGPEYDCSTCSKDKRPEYDPPNDCPGCKLSNSFRIVLHGLKAPQGDKYLQPGVIPDCAKRFGNGKDWPFSFPAEKLQDAYAYVSGILSDSDEKINPEWDETTGRLARILLARRSRAEYARLWKERQRKD